MRTTCSALAAAATVALLAAACGGSHDETEGARDAPGAAEKMDASAGCAESRPGGGGDDP